eukprot:TRINITY_DN10366_c0_g1_i1.p1 TRINITY_DN10366_c0_g1~~TRINITY_DN10366_c0_g1_i1.p1  ORF type:complete len:695 (+),score=172.50 TRINITY_DN10366_c0_g1_i1:105-2189(+)
MSSQGFRATQSAPAYQEMVSEYPLRDHSSPAEDNMNAEAPPASFHSTHAGSPSPPPSQATPQSSPKKSQVIVEPSTGALSILANEMSFEQEAEAEADVFEEPESAEEPIKARSLGKDRTQPTIEVEDEPGSPEAPTGKSTAPPSAGKRTSKRVSVTKTVSKISLSNLLKAKLISAGDEIYYKDEEAVVLGDGWIEHGQDKHPDPEAWIHELVRKSHGRLKDLPKDPWAEIYYGDETLASIRDSYIREGHSEREERKIPRLSRLSTDERRLIYGDDESSSEYDDRRRRPSRSSADDDEEEEEEEIEDEDDVMRVDDEADSMVIAVSDDERPKKKQSKAKKSSTPKSPPKKAAAPKKRKREVEPVAEIDNFDDDMEEHDSPAPPPKRPKKAAASTPTPKRVESDFDSGIWAESPSAAQEPKKKSTQATPARELGKQQQKQAEAQKNSNKKSDEKRPASLELAASSLSAGADSLDDFLTSQGQEIKPVVRPRARAPPQEQQQPSRSSIDDEPWVDTTTPAPVSEQPPAPTKTASPRKVPIKREPTLQLADVVEVVEEEGPTKPTKRKSSAGLTRRSSSGSGEEFDDGKPKQRKIDEIFVKTEEDRATVAERMHKQFDDAEAQQPKRTPSSVAMPPPAPQPRVKKAAPQIQADSAVGAQTATSHFIANGPGPVIVASGLKTHNLVRLTSSSISILVRV